MNSNVLLHEAFHEVYMARGKWTPVSEQELDDLWNGAVKCEEDALKLLGSLGGELKRLCADKRKIEQHEKDLMTVYPRVQKIWEAVDLHQQPPGAERTHEGGPWFIRWGILHKFDERKVEQIILCRMDRAELTSSLKTAAQKLKYVYSRVQREFAETIRQATLKGMIQPYNAALREADGIPQADEWSLVKKMYDEGKDLSQKQLATLVNRRERTIRRWHRQGLQAKLNRAGNKVLFYRNQAIRDFLDKIGFALESAKPTK